jgi:hypothetical protein
VLSRGLKTKCVLSHHGKGACIPYYIEVDIIAHNLRKILYHMQRKKSAKEYRKKVKMSIIAKDSLGKKAYQA